MRQNRIDILCTRPLDASLIDEAKLQAIDIDVLSFIETVPIRNIETIQEIENSILLSTSVVFTSMNAVEAVAIELDGHQPDWQIFCIGTTTHLLVKKYFGEHCIAGTASDAGELANLIVEEHNTEEVIFFCSNRRRNELPDILRRNNIDVHEIAVYETVSIPQIIKKKYDGILFFSPSAVESFFTKNKTDHSTILFAIGYTTADEIRKHIIDVNITIITSDKPGKDNLFKKMMEYYDR